MLYIIYPLARRRIVLKRIYFYLLGFTLWIVALKKRISSFDIMVLKYFIWKFNFYY